MVINYITYDSWWDTDKTILPQLQQDYLLNVYVLSSSEGKKYETKEQYGEGEFIELTQKYRDRDVRSIFVALRMFCTLKKHLKGNEWFWFVMGGNYFLLLFVYLFLPKQRTIITFHNYIPHSNNSNSVIVKFTEYLYSRLKHAMCRRFNHFFLYSRLQYEMFKKDYPNKKCVYCNMPLKDFGPINDVHHNGKTFLFFGAIQDYKRLDLFINAANKLNSKEAKFVVAGQPLVDWEKFESLIDGAKKFICENHFINDEDVHRYFEMADFLVLPYSDSTQSGPSLIAINYGIPIIASRIPTFCELVRDGKNGLLFEPGSIDELSACFEKAINLSDKEYQKMRENQIAFKAQYEEYTKVNGMVESLLKL